MLLFTSEQPNLGPHTYKRRDETSIVDKDKSHTLFTPQDDTWTTLAEEFAERGIAVNLFLFPRLPMDVGTMGIYENSVYMFMTPGLTINDAGDVSTQTGGDIFYHRRYVSEVECTVLTSEVLRIWRRETATDVLVKVRVSAGTSDAHWVRLQALTNS